MTMRKSHSSQMGKHALGRKRNFKNLYCQLSSHNARQLPAYPFLFYFFLVAPRVHAPGISKFGLRVCPAASFLPSQFTSSQGSPNWDCTCTLIQILEGSHNVNLRCLQEPELVEQKQACLQSQFCYPCEEPNAGSKIKLN